jgi:hypothetical protein
MHPARFLKNWQIDKIQSLGEPKRYPQSVLRPPTSGIWREIESLRHDAAVEIAATGGATACLGCSDA